jgi:ribose 5-phosphate isomerase B
MSKPLNEIKLAFGSDHAGFELKEDLREYIKGKVSSVEDFGTYSLDSTDYPDYGHSVAIAVESGQADFGVIICGSGNGINITANKHAGIRSALSWNVEVAELARLHNNANILALPARFISTDEGRKILDAFLRSEFEGGRHQRRVEKIAIEEKIH